MARRGRFGQVTSGQQNLSSFILALAQQNRNLEQSALFNAYYDSSPYGGEVPDYDNIEAWVEARMAEGNLSPAQKSYYLNLLKKAKDHKIQQQYDVLSSSYSATQGANFDEFVSFLKGDGAEKFGDNLPTVLNNYLTYSYNNLVQGQITEEEYNNNSQKALQESVDSPEVYEDLKYNSVVNLYEFQKIGITNIVGRAKGKKTEKVIEANKQLESWYQGWLTKLESEGLSNTVFYDNVKTYLVNTRTTIRADEKTLAAAQAAAFLAARKGAYDSAMATLNAFAKQIGSSLGVDTSSATFSFSDLQKENPAALTAWLSTQSVETRAVVERALNDAAGASRGYIDALNSQGKGNSTEALTAAASITMTRKVSGENTSYDEYVAASATKASLMTAAGNIPGNERIVMENWVKFLRGQSTDMFGPGLKRMDGKYLQDVQTKIDNEANLFEAALRGERITQLPATLIDEIIPSLILSGFLPVDLQVPGSGDNKFTVDEFNQIITNVENEAGLRDGSLQMVYSKNPNETPQILPISSPAPGGGVITRLQMDASGNNYAAQYQGVAIYGSNAGQPDTKSIWGYRIETPNGFLYTDVNGFIYKNPPIDTDKLMLAADGSGIISRDSTVVSAGTEKQYRVRGGYEGEEASINDLVDPSALQKAQSATINPYARVNEDNPLISNLQATSAIVQAIVDTVPAGSRVAQEGVSTLDTTIKVQTQIANMASISQDSGVRIAMMNAQNAAAKAQATKDEILRLAVLKPAPARPNYGRAYQTGEPATPQPGVSYNGIPQVQPQQATGTQAPLTFDVNYVFRGLAGIANPAAALGSFIGGTAIPAIANSIGDILSPSVPPATQRVLDLGTRPSGGGGGGGGAVAPAVSMVGGPVGGVTITSAPGGVAAAQAAQNAFRAGERAPLNIQPVAPIRIINSGPRAGQPAGGGL